MATGSAPRYWFAAKRYGWGWGPPATWQGWVVLVLWLALLAVGVRHFAHRGSVLHVVFACAMVLLLGLICYLKGEPPRWRWGK